LVIGFIEHLQIVTGSNYSAVLNSLNIFILLYLRRLSPGNGFNAIASSASMFTPLVAGDYLPTIQTESESYVTTDGQWPVSLGIKHPSGAYDQIFITARQLRVCWCGTVSLTRGRVRRLQLLLALASAVIFRSESRGTHDYILLSQIRDFIFIASYDSQGCGGDIGPRLHTEYLTRLILY
jgi:hypothetical protein